MKKVFKSFRFAVVLFFIFIYINGCSNDTITNTPVTTAKGVFVLNEGLFGQPTSYDYSFIDLSNDSVHGNIYQNSNGGAYLNSVPDGLVISGNSTLYVSAQGNFGGTGSIYKIDATNNHKIASRDFGKNPYSIALGSSKLCVTNIAGNFVSIMDLNLNPVYDSLNVGPSPAEIVYVDGKYFVAKASYTYENSLSIVDELTGVVTKKFLPGPPIGITSLSNEVYVSTYFNKTVYVLDGSTSSISDSINVPISEPAIGSVILGSGANIYIVGISDTTYQSSVGKKVYKMSLTSKTIDPSFSISMSGTDDVYGIAYEPSLNRIYIANSKGGLTNGEIRVYDTSGALIKTYSDIKGKFPHRFAFKY